MRDRKTEVTFALFILASNDVLKPMLKEFNFFPMGFIGYSFIDHAKQFKFQWKDR